MEPVDHVFSIVIIGDTEVGKTSLIHRISKDVFLPKDDSSSMFLSGLMHSTVIKSEGNSVRINIWDTTSIDDYKGMNVCHFQDAQGCIFLFSLNNPYSLQNVYKWAEEFDRHSLSPHIFFLVGAKDDLPTEEKIVKPEDIKEVAQKLNANAFLVSSLEGSGVEELKRSLSKELIHKFSMTSENSEVFQQISEGTNQKLPKKKKKVKSHKTCTIF